MNNLSTVYEKSKYINVTNEQSKLLGDKFVGINGSNSNVTKVDMKYKAAPTKKHVPMKEVVDVVTDDFKVKIVGLIARRESKVSIKTQNTRKSTFRTMF